MDAEGLAKQFFEAKCVTSVSSHEEWLLRLCATLCDREARVVQRLERGQLPSSEALSGPFFASVNRRPATAAPTQATSDS
jgi:hypothetical protein